MSESVFELFDPDEGNDGVRAESHEGRHVTSEKCHRTLAEGEANDIERPWRRRTLLGVARRTIPIS